MSILYKLFGIETERDKLEKLDKEYKDRAKLERDLLLEGWDILTRQAYIYGKDIDHKFECAKLFAKKYNIDYRIEDVNSFSTIISYGPKKFNTSRATPAVFIKHDNIQVAKKAFSIYYKTYKKNKAKTKKEYNKEIEQKAIDLLKSH